MQSLKLPGSVTSFSLNIPMNLSCVASNIGDTFFPYMMQNSVGLEKADINISLSQNQISLVLCDNSNPQIIP